MNFIPTTATKDDIWVFELTHIDEELRINEPELRKTRWFDYRDKLPLELTQLFTDKYIEIYKEIYGMHRDIEYSERVTGNLTLADLVPLWRARQSADGIGCPYEFYIRYAMMRTFERQWKYIPRPNQLIGEELELDCKDMWETTKREILFLANNPFYKIDSFIGHPDQHDYHSYLVQNVRVRPVPEMVLTRLVFREKCLSEELALKYFGEDIFNSAKRHFYA